MMIDIGDEIDKLQRLSEIEKSAKQALGDNS